MSDDDLAYHLERAAVERVRALDSPAPEIARCHAELASIYEGLIARWENSLAEQDLEPLPHIAQQSQPDTPQ